MVCKNGTMRARLKIKEIAQEKGVSLRKLANRSEVDINRIRDLMRDPYLNATTYTLQKLATVLGVDVSELIESVPDNKSSQVEP
jgi:transcriptional regulator with XRE-family HTH domain